jgi:HSP20 family protein
MTMQQSASQAPAKKDLRDSFRDLYEDIGKWFDYPWRPWPAARFFEVDGKWTPRVDIFEEGNELVVKAELPGVKKEDMEVTLEGDTLIIRGERKQEKEVKEDHYYRKESSYGSFSRQFTVPAGITSADIKASYKDGILEVRLPKPAQPESAKTTIPVS